MKNRTYRYFNGNPLYPFGFGLSYTSWEISSAKYSEKKIFAEVRNTGSMDGDALIQVYIGSDDPDAPVHPRLCGFRRVTVKAGQTGNAAIELDPFMDTVIDEHGQRRKMNGRMILYVGMSQPDDFSVSLCGVRPVEIRI